MSITKVLRNKCIHDGPLRSDMTYLRLEKIKILNTRHFPDCTCVETVSFKFCYCDANGAIPVSNNRFIIEADIETGYLPEGAIERDMRQMFLQYPIFNIERLLAAFKYREFYTTNQKT